MLAGAPPWPDAAVRDLELLTVYGIGYCLSRARIDPFQAGVPAQSVQRRARQASLA